MKMLTKRISALFLLIFCISCLLAGCTANTMYECRASIYVTTTTAADTAISSSDLETAESLVETYRVILQSKIIQDQIREEYPDVKYILSLESRNETELYALIATGENPEYLDEICNMAVSLLCEKIPQIVEGSSCKVLDYATPAQLVGTN